MLQERGFKRFSQVRRNFRKAPCQLTPLKNSPTSGCNWIVYEGNCRVVIWKERGNEDVGHEKT